MAADVRAGLTSPFKELSPRYFYDERGSELFERITELEEYYPTRCEREILDTYSEEICAAANRPASLIELGSGSARKTQVLLDAMRDGELPGDLLPGRHLRGDHPRAPPSGSPTSTTGSMSMGWSATSSSTSSGCRSRGRG